MIKKDYLPKDTPFDPDVMKDETKWGSYGAHDPAIIKEGEMYYVFSTDTGGKDHVKAGIQIRQSPDLIHWTFVGRAFSDGVPREAYNWTEANGLWAPEVVKMNGKFYLYYAASQFGKTQSFIGVAVSDSVTGPYEDLGLVYKSVRGTEGPNAIDPNITFTPEGQVYMVFGSFFGGLYVNEIEPKTGKFKTPGPGTLIAKRHTSVDRALEGPYIIYNDVFDYYYLFVSYDSLFADYNIRIGRSKSITGPYTDYNGKELTDIEGNQDEIGMKVLGSYKFSDGEGCSRQGIILC
ncbi:arabinan endo-1,5-alpha-L-arabinosidase [Halolactibacillus sp. JCM 19043]|uniref:arabinan endo-1,5-alpha-L-arabinosidase n=1 Tax=Halolactibacillus sp. JCM 19043 TaxID=1460638 RepID=UPI00078100F8|nr:arabinan endo-1,5-alpha-L-arabinosidase [Halolactibacillus sp. JCM 19043]